MSENKGGRYLKYAIGEVVLVVLGILIALSINNWNEDRKDQRKAKAYLASIRSDLMQDLEEIEGMSDWKKRVICFYEAFPHFPLSDELLEHELKDTNCRITYKAMFGFQKSFRSNTSTFDAMISDGSANLISNRTLFAKIQRLYKFYNPAMLDVFNNHRAESSKLNYKWASLITFEPNTNITAIKDTSLIADLTIFFRKKQFYIRHLGNIQSLINEIITLIDAELNE